MWTDDDDDGLNVMAKPGVNAITSSGASTQKYVERGGEYIAVSSMIVWIVNCADWLWGVSNLPGTS